ncbi:hypothetical protein P9112_002679 [Eukaryota sp. TZLM1-RC]
MVSPIPESRSSPPVPSSAPYGAIDTELLPGNSSLVSAKIRAMKILHAAPPSVLYGTQRVPRRPLPSTPPSRPSPAKPNLSPTEDIHDLSASANSSTLSLLVSANHHKQQILKFIKDRARKQRRSIWMTGVRLQTRNHTSGVADHVQHHLIKKRRQKLVIDLLSGYLGYSKFLKMILFQINLLRAELLMKKYFIILKSLSNPPDFSHLFTTIRSCDVSLHFKIWINTTKKLQHLNELHLNFSSSQSCKLIRFSFQVWTRRFKKQILIRKSLFNSVMYCPPHVDVSSVKSERNSLALALRTKLNFSDCGSRQVVGLAEYLNFRFCHNFGENPDDGTLYSSVILVVNHFKFWRRAHLLKQLSFSGSLLYYSAFFQFIRKSLHRYYDNQLKTAIHHQSIVLKRGYLQQMFKFFHYRQGLYEEVYCQVYTKSLLQRSLSFWYFFSYLSHKLSEFKTLQLRLRFSLWRKSVSVLNCYKLCKFQNKSLLLRKYFDVYLNKTNQVISLRKLFIFWHSLSNKLANSRQRSRLDKVSNDYFEFVLKRDVFSTWFRRHLIFNWNQLAQCHFDENLVFKNFTNWRRAHFNCRKANAFYLSKANFYMEKGLLLPDWFGYESFESLSIKSPQFKSYMTQCRRQTSRQGALFFLSSTKTYFMEKKALLMTSERYRGRLKMKCFRKWISNSKTRRYERQKRVNSRGYAPFRDTQLLTASRLQSVSSRPSSPGFTIDKLVKCFPSRKLQDLSLAEVDVQRRYIDYLLNS